MEDDTGQKCISHLPQKRQRTINRIREGDCSTWLSVYQHTITDFSCLLMSFETALHCDMGSRQPKCQDSVMGVVSLLALVMPLIVKKGGLVIARHNESRDLNIELLKLTGLTQITKEPIQLRCKRFLGFSKRIIVRYLHI